MVKCNSSIIEPEEDYGSRGSCGGEDLVGLTYSTASTGYRCQHQKADQGDTCQNHYDQRTHTDGYYGRSKGLCELPKVKDRYRERSGDHREKECIQKM